ncbi:Ig-like domain-containing protein [Rufibacter roseolus]|uniref:Ig-like domain-containing protein n=1 Tax=Rufibacter roseolus TaxID=2817375 RepID=UPI001B301DF2|nr:hypothetical protein [Rufibacter roseolus]
MKELYKDSRLTVEIDYYYSKNSCQNGKQFKYKLRVSGDQPSAPTFLNWTMDYIDCNGNVYFQKNSIEIWKKEGGIVDQMVIESMDYMFTATSMENPFYDVSLSSKRVYGSGIKVTTVSKEAIGIDGVKDLYLGEATQLTVKGGLLGIGGEWVWYEGDCGGNKIGTGKSITVTPGGTSKFYVRAEGKNNITNCAQATVNVDKRSKPPTSIMAHSNICLGDNALLTVGGGSLGAGADWIWYEGSCGVKRVGQGKSISVKPKGPTTYYVRAEGELNTTECVQLTINTYDKSIAPSAIVSEGGPEICKGQQIKLKVTGGNLSSDGKWVWYSGSCGGTAVGTGPVMVFSPMTTTTYHVQGEGYCNSTSCVSLTVVVNERSEKPDRILAPTTVYKGNKIELTVAGGKLGEGAEWKWFKGTSGSGSLLGSGASIVVNPRKVTNYYVKAVSPCGETENASVLIDPVKSHYFDKIYSKRPNKFLHLGYGFGVEMIQYAEYSKFSTEGNTSAGINYNPSNVSIQGLGLKGEFVFHPIMKEFFSLGLISSFSLGTTPLVFSNGEGERSSGGAFKEEYFYTKLNVGGELAIGIKPVKFLMKAARSFQGNDYKIQFTTNGMSSPKYLFRRSVSQETIGFGLRLGSYAGKGGSGRGNNLDLTYNLTRDAGGKSGAWKSGGALSWWIHSAIKLQMEAMLNPSESPDNPSSNSYKNACWQLSLIFNRNRFY